MKNYLKNKNFFKMLILITAGLILLLYSEKKFLYDKNFLNIQKYSETFKGLLIENNILSIRPALSNNSELNFDMIANNSSIAMEFSSVPDTIRIYISEKKSFLLILNNQKIIKHYTFPSPNMNSLHFSITLNNSAVIFKINDIYYSFDDIKYDSFQALISIKNKAYFKNFIYKDLKYNSEYLSPCKYKMDISSPMPFLISLILLIIPLLSILKIKHFFIKTLFIYNLPLFACFFIPKGFTEDYFMLISFVLLSLFLLTSKIFVKKNILSIIFSCIAIFIMLLSLLINLSTLFEKKGFFVVKNTELKEDSILFKDKRILFLTYKNIKNIGFNINKKFSLKFNGLEWYIPEKGKVKIDFIKQKIFVNNKIFEPILEYTKKIKLFNSKKIIKNKTFFIITTETAATEISDIIINGTTTFFIGILLPRFIMISIFLILFILFGDKTIFTLRKAILKGLYLLRNKNYTNIDRDIRHKDHLNVFIITYIFIILDFCLMFYRKPDSNFFPLFKYLLFTLVLYYNIDFQKIFPLKQKDKYDLE